jgi:2-amino-4-hydroxy-6-hydroxymethyldihydropteridine diphosphokinase
MSPHRVYLSLGSNIEPEANLSMAIELLAEYGEVRAVSGMWESRAVGGSGPNFLNASVLLLTEIEPSELKDRLVRPIESSLGRVRTEDKNAPRTIDIDVMLVDDQPFNLDLWDDAFVLMPIAELLPETTHPNTRVTLREAADRAQQHTWIVRRPGLLKSPP